MFNTSSVPMEEFLAQIATELDISEAEYRKAVDHYEAVGKWLGGDGSAIAVYRPAVYPQGSFRLGTIVKPVGEDEYDLDLVCELDHSSQSLTPQQLKKMVGSRLQQNASYITMLEEKNRCWRLKYAGEFHMDILPAIPDRTTGSSAILVPDKEIANWSSSDPQGYAEWFKQKMIVELSRFAEARGANVEQVPAFAVRTPLQRAIQLLKRHRDIRFNGRANADDRPISIIVTTLAARIYQNEPDVRTALANIVNTLALHAALLVQGGRIDESVASRKIIEKGREGRWHIPNPVNPAENFADKWHENGDRKARAFFQWVEWVKVDLERMIANAPKEKDGETLRAVFGAAVVGSAMGRLEKSGRFSPTVVSAPHIKITDPGKPWSPSV